MKKIVAGALLAALSVALFAMPSFAGYYRGKVYAAGTLPGVTAPTVFIRFGTKANIANSADQRWYTLASSDPNRDLATALTAQAGDLWVQFWLEDAQKNTNMAPVTGLHLIDSSLVQ